MTLLGPTQKHLMLFSYARWSEVGLHGQILLALIALEGLMPSVTQFQQGQIGAKVMTSHESRGTVNPFKQVCVSLSKTMRSMEGGTNIYVLIVWVRASC